ncbi:MAG: hypothetical protein WBO31_05735 [Saprospiraceae bacterium]
MKTSILNQILLFLTTLMVVLGSCTQESTNELESETQKILNFLSQNYGFDKKDLKVDKEYIVAESDIIFPIIDFWENYGNIDHQDKHSLQERIHRKSSVKVFVPNKGKKYIDVYYSASLSTPWRNALIDAIIEWNLLNGKIIFKGPYIMPFALPVGNIVVTPKGDMQKDILGESYSPDNKGNPGSHIFVNKYRALTHTHMKLTLAHELGHTIGFMHTNTNDGLKLYTNNYTCDNKSDTKSVMCAGDKNGVVWNGFSLCDKKAFYSLYPL